MFISYFGMALFFKYWLGRKQKIFTLKALFNVCVLTAVVGLLFVLLAIILGDTSNVLFYLYLVLLVYSFTIFIFAITRGAEVSFGYVIAGSLISLVIIFILIFLLLSAFIALGLMTIPMPTG